jgi:DNA-binding HxlR family transcriptional regulator
MDSERAVCESFQHAAQLVGKRWVSQIVWVLLDGPRRFSVIRTAIPDISDTVLSDRLRELEAAGILTRAVTPSTPVLIEYALTERGRELAKVIDGLAKWADRWSAAETNRVPART